MNRIAITGSSGAYGCGVIRAIRRRHPGTVILGMDVRTPTSDPPDEFRECDILSDRLGQMIAEFRPDTMIHLAFVVNPIHDEALMAKINQEGTENFLNAARVARPERVLVSSSATAYGASPDNPIPLSEDAPIRAQEEFRYTADKVAVEASIARFAADEPDIAVSWTRPAIIYGPGITNYLIKFFVNAKVIALPDGRDCEIQLVHIEDVANATLAILEQDARGPFNVAPEDWITLKGLARITRRLAFPVPFAVCRAWSAAWWACRLPWFRSPAGLWNFIRDPWVVTPARLTRELGFRFRHSSLDTLTQLLESRGLVRGAYPQSTEDGMPRAGDAIIDGPRPAAGRREKEIA